MTVYIHAHIACDNDVHAACSGDCDAHEVMENGTCVGKHCLTNRPLTNYNTNQQLI